ncbi:MarR family winged helix-turn-helix transcriptional regulator [Tateyamaria sp. SN6-1]|uniref:MarR family winged helix-turn-helix transcriptional regulator n=1 Tax=Tateyamaria sp. SN6-1 TaxID=3092148 RepID=UPI0039F5EAAC
MTYTFSDFSTLCACQALRQAARKVSRRYDAALRPVHLSAGQFTTLAALLRPDPVSISILAEQLGMDRTTLTRDLKPLERRELVTSQSGTEDARVRQVALTNAGRDLLMEAIPLWEVAQRQTKKEMSDVDWRELRNDLILLTE